MEPSYDEIHTKAAEEAEEAALTVPDRLSPLFPGSGSHA